MQKQLREYLLIQLQCESRNCLAHISKRYVKKHNVPCAKKHGLSFTPVLKCTIPKICMNRLALSVTPLRRLFNIVSVLFVQ